MVNTLVQLKHSTINNGNAFQIYCTGVSVTLSKNNSKIPNSNLDAYPVDVQTESRENVKYILNNVEFGVGGLSYKRLIDLFALKNDNTNPLYLNIKFGNSKMSVAFGSMTSGSSSLAVDDVSFFSIGDKITVKGAGPNSSNLDTEVLSITSFTNTLGLTNTAGTTVSGAGVAMNDGYYLPDSLLTTTDIPVTIDGTATVNIDASDTSDGYMPGLSLSFIEVKV